VNDHERTRTDPERDSPGRVRDSSRGPKQARRVINIKTHKPWPRKGTQRRWAQSARLEGEERRVEPGRLARHRAPRATLHVRGTAACARALREGSPACGARHPRAAWRQDAQQRLLGDGDPHAKRAARETVLGLRCGALRFRTPEGSSYTPPVEGSARPASDPTAGPPASHGERVHD